jgi:hypothetical protein
MADIPAAARKPAMRWGGMPGWPGCSTAASMATLKALASEVIVINSPEASPCSLGAKLPA